MNEATCKAALCKVLRAKLPPAESRVYRHEDAWTGGIPDISITANGHTLWVEVKLDRPGRRGKVTELQRTSLQALWGYLLTFEITMVGGFGARLEDAEGNPYGRFYGRTKKDVYESVAISLIGRVKRLCSCGAPLTSGRCSGNCERDE